jgi:DNA-binding transcriptional MerR regulator
MTQPIPDKIFFKIREVAAITEIEPYVLRYWESEFPLLSPQKNKGGQRIYKRRDIDIILQIKKLLYEEGYTIAGAKKILAQRINKPPKQLKIDFDRENLIRVIKELRNELNSLLILLDRKTEYNPTYASGSDQNIISG